MADQSQRVVMASDPVVAELLAKLGLPRNLREVEIRIAAGEPVTVRCVRMAADAHLVGLVETVESFQLVAQKAD